MHEEESNFVNKLIQLLYYYYIICNVYVEYSSSCMHSETVLLFIGQSRSVDFAFKEHGIVLDVGDVVEDRDESECGTA